MSNIGKIKYLVVDTTAFIKNLPLQDIAENLLTTQEVIDEITNKRQLRHLVVLPYDLSVKEVFNENINFVTEFAKKTGDYKSLSATDIKVIALTYQLEKEHVGLAHLKTEPTYAKQLNLITQKHKAEEDAKDNLVGFYKREVNDLSSKNVVSDLSKLNVKEENEKNNATENAALNQVYETKTECVNEIKLDEEHLTEIELNLTSENTEILTKINSDDEIDTSSSSESESDDEGGWITPGNVQEKKKQLNSELVQEELSNVACITSDFAMQNVLKQIGLNVSSLDGKIIKQLRTYIFRCYACFKTTSVMTKVFCPNCGHQTLKKVAVSIDENGKQIIHINARKPLSTRGKIFSLPTPKGGKHANNPILFEDQRTPDQRPTRLAKTKNDPLAPDYIAGYSPFVMRDVTSKSAMLGIRNGQPIKHWMRKNPNETRKKRK